MILMALLAKEWRSGLQQVVAGGAVGRMAIRAVICDGAVFPQERAALFGMAGVAGLIDRCFDQQLRSDGSMRVVAIAAGHLAGIQRMG